MTDAYQINMLRKRINKLEKQKNDLSLERNDLLKEMSNKLDILISLFMSSNNVNLEEIKNIISNYGISSNGINNDSRKSTILDDPVIHIPEIELGSTSSKNVSIESKSIKRSTKDHEKIFDSLME